ncbi:MAG TPA: ATP phosphoribosyltransferase regulatory subunit [Nitrospirales bacterium]|nr:ATP phosphoribosyltransferase regulatory subunit [Nitrospirales bacterium]
MPSTVVIQDDEMETTARSQTPPGMAAMLPPAAAQKRRAEDLILSVLQKWGFQEVVPPAFEYLDVLSRGLGDDLIEKGYKVLDRWNGRDLILRPDVTPQIARMVAMGMFADVRPLRLCYSAPVYRYDPDHAGRNREIFQIGAELIGPESATADAEMIVVAMACLRELGLERFTVTIGQGEFFNTLLSKALISDTTKWQLRCAAAKKNLTRLQEILSGAKVEEALTEIILAVPNLFGHEHVIDEAASLAGHWDDSLAALDWIREVHGLLAKEGHGEHVLVDLGEIRAFDYYTGLVFNIFIEGSGWELGGGGRYDHLVGCFGSECPSTGFAFDLGRLFRLLG